MWNYFKSFFIKEKIHQPKIIQYHYELKVVWYSNFMKFTTKIKHDTSSQSMNIYDVLNKHIPQYNKLVIQERLVDYLHRTRTAMFTTNFKAGIYHISSLQLVKGTELDGGIISYDSPLAEAVYNISIEIDKDHEWEIV